MAGFLEQDNGASSSMRLIAVGWCATLFSCIGYVTYRTKALPDVPSSLIELTLILVLGKVGQKWIEGKTSSG